MPTVESPAAVDDPFPDATYFHLLEITPAQRRRRRISLGISFLFQIAALLFFGRALELVPSRIEGLAEKEYVFLRLPTAPAEKESPPPKPPRRTAPRPHLPRPRLHPVERSPVAVVKNLPNPVAPKVFVPPKTISELPRVAASPSAAAPKSEAPRREMAVVRTNVFRGSGSSAAPTLNQPVREVQTGGLGSPDGFPGEAQRGSRGNVAKLGSFDLPSGPGYGNGSGGSRGVRGTVASADFGNGIASGGGAGGAAGGTGGGSGRGGVRETRFGDVRPTQEARRPQPRAAAPAVQPVEILSKPNPAYTEEARRLRVEGEVVLEVVFAASGELRVLRVVRGLGHGLDHAALRAAEQIRFKPAHRDGQPVDTRATLRILFQLAE